jgi:guanylate kinase
MVKVFILPPSTEELEKRLKTRAQDSEEVVAGRMAKAADEMSHWREYDYVIINTDVQESLVRLTTILEAERLRINRQVGLADFVNRLRGAD